MTSERKKELTIEEILLTPLINSEEFRLLQKMIGVKCYVDNLKYSEHNPEIGYLYDNKTEFDSLLQQMNELGTKNEKMVEIMLSLQSDIEEVERRKQSPVRNPEEEAFYRHIVGINSYIRETKQREPGYIFDNIPEVEGLLSRLGELNTQDHDILAIMDAITKDIKKVIAIISEENAAQYQERLNTLNIGINAQQK
jgi:hypothetical protein